MLYKNLFKPLLFLLSPEVAHSATVLLFKRLHQIPGMRPILKKWFAVKHPNLVRQVFGLRFDNPVGLAAGFDKDGKYYPYMSTLGFGFIELGTVTPKPQVGNPQPRLFRLPKDEALINRMGFNNMGVDHLVNQLKKGRPDNVIIGGNIGKNKTTPNEEALKDYAICFEKLFPYVDYFVVNVSSPNTPNLRALQEKEPLTALLTHLKALNEEKSSPKPILLKIAPDLNNDQLNDVIEIILRTKLDGIIATNTTIARSPLTYTEGEIEQIGAGGLSGKPVKDRSTEVIRYISEKSQGKIPIIGVGGIQSGKDAKEKLEAGATLVQCYTGLIYEGPSLVKNINKYLLNSDS